MPILHDPDLWPESREPSMPKLGSPSDKPVELDISSQKKKASPTMQHLTIRHPPEDASTARDTTQHNGASGPLCTDRAELIERIKRGESPTWAPKRALQEEYIKANGQVPGISAPEQPPKSTSLLPAAEIDDRAQAQTAQGGLHSPFEIERPRSALHAGDFTEDAANFSIAQQPQPSQSSSLTPLSLQQPRLATSPTTPWYRPARPLPDYEESAPWSSNSRPWEDSRSPRSRAPSISSFSSLNYVLKPPTTPLVQQSNNADLDLPGQRDRSASPEKGNRRHTLPAHALRDWQSQQGASASPPNQIARSYRREVSYPSAYIARRSNWTMQPPPSPPTPAFLRSRRTSFSSEASPRQRASMVGSYEESILRGRMSTPPSKPFDFTAHIGVLGKGKRPKMPAHAIVPFQAVFYDWPSNDRRSSANDEPSPYVGQINLQNIEKPANSSTPGRTGYSESQDDLDHEEMGLMMGEYAEVHALPEKRKRSSQIVNPPDGSYRIPRQGQIQVVIKNPYKTALKLFLVPYDLTEMEAGQKTFVRQRYYSAGPILERPLASTGRQSLNSARAKPTLRYLIHLNICSPSRGRFYVYGHIRVVFANRVPDDKEHLTKEVQEPRPKYSPWKPQVDSGLGAKALAEQAYRRRSSSSFIYNQTASANPAYGTSSFSFAEARNTNTPPVPPIPFYLSTLPPQAQADVMDIASTASEAGLASPMSEKLARLHSQQSTDGIVSGSGSVTDSIYAKLSKGDAGYGGIGLFGRPGTPELSGEGLLARRLRVLGMVKDGSSSAVADGADVNMSED